MGQHPQGRPPRSAGVLLYRLLSSPAPTSDQSQSTRAEVYLVHPGGPYFSNKDVWGIPKGIVEDGENEETAARREFAEETGFRAPPVLVDLGTVTTHRGKVIHAFAGEWTASGAPPPVQSNTCPVQWPPKSGNWIEVPEVDEGHFFSLELAGQKMHGGQELLLQRVVALIGRGGSLRT